MTRNAATVLFFLHCLMTTQLAFGEFVVTYRTATDSNSYHDYYNAAINLALEKTREEYGDYRTQGVINTGHTLRSLSDAVSDAYPNLLIEVGYDEKLTANGALTYIDIPIDGGIVGYRVCFVNPAIKDEITRVNSLNDLSKYTIIQGIGWVDTDIMRANGLKVKEISNYMGMFKMVAAGHADLFCRGANQLQAEYEEYKSISSLTYDESFALVYPLPRFFYLNSKNTLLKERMTKGLKIAFKDGSLRKLWNKSYQSNIDFSQLKNRKIWYLHNPFLNTLPKDYEQYFFNPLK